MWMISYNLIHRIKESILILIPDRIRPTAELLNLYVYPVRYHFILKFSL